MQVAIVLFPRMTALDAVGPYEVLQRVPDIDVVFVGAEKTVVRTENGLLGLQVDATFAEADDTRRRHRARWPGHPGADHRSRRPGVAAHRCTRRRRTPPRCAADR